MPKKIPRPSDFTRCYGCGADNPRGLALDFHREGEGAAESVVASFVPPAELGGYGRILHGGVTATLADEAFGWAIWGLLGKLGVTTDLAVRYVASLRCGEPLTVRGFIDHHDARGASVRAEIRDDSGRLAATASGTLRFVSQRAVERMGAFKAG